MPDQAFWRERFIELGVHSVGPGLTKTEAELEEHRQIFLRAIRLWLDKLDGPVLDFGCGVGRWVMDLPRPYMGLDLLPEHLEVCRAHYGNFKDVEFRCCEDIYHLPEKIFKSIFTCTVLQHIVEPELRRETMRQLHRLLTDDGVLLSVEWANDQKDYDWCTAIRKSDFKKWFIANAVGEVIETERRHSIWFCEKKRKLFDRYISYRSWHWRYPARNRSDSCLEEGVRQKGDG